MTSWEKREEHHVTALKEAEEVMTELIKAFRKTINIPLIMVLPLSHVEKWLEKWCGKG